MRSASGDDGRKLFHCGAQRARIQGPRCNEPVRPIYSIARVSLPGLLCLSLHSRRASWLLEIAYKNIIHCVYVCMCEVGSSSVGHTRNEKVCAIKTVTYVIERKEGFHSLKYNGPSCLDVLQKLRFLPATPYNGVTIKSILYEITSWNVSSQQIRCQK
jgi:hypothetical protein